MSEREQKFVEIGLSAQKAKETAKNAALSQGLFDAILAAEKLAHRPVSKATGTLLYHVETKMKGQIKQFEPMLIEYVALGKLDSEAKLTGTDQAAANTRRSQVDRVLVPFLRRW
ncbi:hypothetical protein HPB48_015354 [Haemaphysalis longicornis]|uniref:Glutaminyl-tRNA synthetase class Ib non-specific RNA-binding domain-containing protein n=1 Tax=Haemaphysalis longicornis TaxID=44386 RepID=A0A9J6FLL3_HAELO|nr:hypothetical protein HPB48_015652 [Haemaphysalis longicornis]KAH9364019.1 hypothetical protein HPB48_015354 [Haemaphysalis longicornis]